MSFSHLCYCLVTSFIKVKVKVNKYFIPIQRCEINKVLLLHGATLAVLQNAMGVFGALQNAITLLLKSSDAVDFTLPNVWEEHSVSPCFPC